MRSSWFVAAVVIASWAASCGDDGATAIDAGIDATVAVAPFATLSEYGFFEGNGSTQRPVAGVVPFDVISPLFADFTGKHRFIRLPAGGKITYSADATWGFPTGTMIIKSFGVGERLIETRVLIKKGTGWLPTTYLWNEAQTEASLLLTGARVPVVVMDEQGTDVPVDYRVPDQNQCYGCHGTPGVTDLLGLRTRQLNHDFDYGGGTVENQIAHLDALGVFAAPPPPAGERAALADPYAAGGDTDKKARAWLEANCAHCHNPSGVAASTNLYLNVTVAPGLNLGFCRVPNAAGPGTGGRHFDIVPGKPDESVMTFRIASTVAGIKMPEMPIQLVDQRGVDLITAWIAAMPATGCN